MAIAIGTGVLAVIQWVIDHPQAVADAEAAGVAAVKRVIAVWDAYQAGTKTHDELLAEWAKHGIDIGAVEQHWLARHPIATGPASSGLA